MITVQGAPNPPQQNDGESRLKGKFSSGWRAQERAGNGAVRGWAARQGEAEAGKGHLGSMVGCRLLSRATVCSRAFYYGRRSTQHSSEYCLQATTRRCRLYADTAAKSTGVRLVRLPADSYALDVNLGQSLCQKLQSSAVFSLWCSSRSLFLSTSPKNGPGSPASLPG